MADEEKFRFETLSPRQLECLRIIAAPMTAKEAAATLGVSPKTVETHLRDAVLRLGLRDTREAVRALRSVEAVGSGITLTDFSRVTDSRRVAPPLSGAPTPDYVLREAFSSPEREVFPGAWIREPRPNELSRKARLIYIAGATAACMMTITTIIILLDALERLRLTFISG